jgi:hypothetical protein
VKSVTAVADTVVIGSRIIPGLENSPKAEGAGSGAGIRGEHPGGINVWRFDAASLFRFSSWNCRARVGGNLLTPTLT